MDKNVTSESWNTLTGSTWKDNYTKLMNVKTTINGIHSLSIYLPYCSTPSRYPNKLLTFEKLQKDKEYQKIATNIMKLTMQEEYGRKVVFLSLSIKIRFTEQSYKKEPGFLYIVAKNYVTIKKYIGTTDVDKIEKHAESLLAECKRFNFMYCDIN